MNAISRPNTASILLMAVTADWRLMTKQDYYGFAGAPANSRIAEVDDYLMIMSEEGELFVYVNDMDAQDIEWRYSLKATD